MNEVRKFNIPAELITDLLPKLATPGAEFYVNADDREDSDGSRWVGFKWRGVWYTMIIQDQETIHHNAEVRKEEVGA